jgi:hypothetical protein
MLFRAKAYDSDLSVRHAINVLLRYSLLQRESDAHRFSMHPMIHLWIQEGLPLQLRSQYTREALVVLNRAYKELRTNKARMVWQISLVTDNVKQYRSDYKNKLSYRVTKLYTANNWFGRVLFSTYSFYLRLHVVVEDILVWAI